MRQQRSLSPRSFVLRDNRGKVLRAEIDTPLEHENQLPKQDKDPDEGGTGYPQESDE